MGSLVYLRFISNTLNAHPHQIDKEHTHTLIAIYANSAREDTANIVSI